MGNRIRLVGIAILAAGLVLAGASTATFAQDGPPDEYTTIYEEWSAFYNETWSELSPADVLGYEATFTGLFEDSTLPNCRVLAGAMSAVPSLVTGTEAEFYAGQYIVQSIESGFMACFFAR